MTNASGQYSLAVEPGTYTLVLQALAGPVTLAQFSQARPEPAPSFPALFWTSAGGDGTRADTVVVEAGASATGLDFAAASGEAGNAQIIGC